MSERYSVGPEVVLGDGQMVVTAHWFPVLDHSEEDPKLARSARTVAKVHDREEALRIAALLNWYDRHSSMKIIGTFNV